MVTLIDSYTEANQSIWTATQDLHPSDSVRRSAQGQSFTCSIRSLIDSVKFYMYKANNPIGNAHAVLYSHSGTYGTSSVPTGSPLATSDDFDISDLTGGAVLYTMNFTGEQRYEMQPNTYYCIVLESPTTGTIDGTNYYLHGVDFTSPTHDGNYVSFANGSWSYNSSWDNCFYVYGEIIVPPHRVTFSGTGKITTSGDRSPPMKIYKV